MSFQTLALIEPILKALKNEGYTAPTSIQAQAIPLILQRRDLFGCAQTGTGKTAAFAIPILQLLHEQKLVSKEQRTLKALIITPTRELAIQIKDSFDVYGQFTGLKTAVIFGGVSQHEQVNTLRRGVDILVATPGRLLDLVDQNFLNLRSIGLLVLDEADCMLDMGFVHDIKKIIAKVPAQRQTLFFSATMAPAIRKLADTLLTNPAEVTITPVSSTADTIRQAVYFVEKDNKRSLLKHVLSDKDVHMALVFTRTKHGADRVAKELNRNNIPAAAIHGNKSQQARQKALLQFKAKEIRVLVATDIAARGIDIDELSHVINYELPNVPETYVHRIGRTGRAGAQGIAVSFCDPEEKLYLRDIQKLINRVIPVEDEHPYKHKNSFSSNNVPVAAKTKGFSQPAANRFSPVKRRNTRYNKAAQ